jgi:hypothetical protein
MSHQIPLDALIDDNDDFSFTQVIFNTNSLRYFEPSTEENAAEEASVETAFQIDVTDESAATGCVLIDVGVVDGNVDDFLGIQVSIATLPGTVTDVPCVTIGAGLGDKEITVYQVGADLLVRYTTDGKLIAVPNADGTLSTTLTDGPNDVPPLNASPYFGTDDTQA